MPNWSRSPIDTLVLDARRLYANAKDDTEIAAALALYKVPAATLDEGLALVQSVQDLSGALGGETVDKVRATGAVNAATDTVEGDFAADRDMARTAYPRGSEEYVALKLRGPVPEARAAILGAAAEFYDTLGRRPGLIGPIPGLTPEILTERRAAVTAAEGADTAQADETGDVRGASGDRQGTVAALRDHASDTARVAKRALADRPDLLAKLGLPAR